MSDGSIWIPIGVIVGVYILLLLIIHIGKLPYKMIFPAPPSNYTENFFREKLFYANVYKHDGNIGNNWIIVVNSIPQ